MVNEYNYLRNAFFSVYIFGFTKRNSHRATTQAIKSAYLP